MHKRAAAGAAAEGFYVRGAGLGLARALSEVAASRGRSAELLHFPNPLAARELGRPEPQRVGWPCGARTPGLER